MKQVLGILGGGQLATMMCEAAARIEGVQTWVLSPDATAPARHAATHFIRADYTDIEALDRLRAHCDVVTVDNEHIPVTALQHLEASLCVRPSSHTLATIQDRLFQRRMLTHIDAPQTPHWAVADDETLAQVERVAPFPAVLKSRRDGYDGYGQVVVRSAAELDQAWIDIGRRPGVLEAFIDFQAEVSMLGARTAGGETSFYPLVANEHVEGQLWRSCLPATDFFELENAARDIWLRIAEQLDYVGLMAVEFFVDATGQLLVNEIAPRVHNSGHATQRSHAYSQFDLHVRAVLDHPLPDLGEVKATVMLNLFAEHHIDSEALARDFEQAHGGRIVLYGKAPRPRRKTGHWLLATEQAQAAEAALRAARRHVETSESA